ncbi:hypothetical protein P3W45_000972 [Vairimorpha bombi]|jgi:hypothetical protein
MNEFINILKNLQKGDKISLNVLIMISESQPGIYESIGKLVLTYYKDCMNIDSVRWYLNVLCTKNENFLEYFSRYQRIFDGIKDSFTDLLKEYKSKKRFKIDHPTTDISKESVNINTDLSKNKGSPSKKNTGHSYNILYEKVQCKLCGLRYKENDHLYDIHIEDHMRKSRALDEKTTLSREYFSTYDGWVKSMEKITLNLKIDKVEKVIHTGDNVYCKMCGSKIDAVWDEEEDEFVLNECVQLDEEEFAHKLCVI